MKTKTVSMALALSLLLGASYTQAHSDKGSHIKNYQHNYHTYARGENNAHRHRKHTAHKYKHKTHRTGHITVHHHYHTRHRVHRHKSYWSDDYWKIAGGHILLNELLYHGHNHRYCRHHFDH